MIHSITITFQKALGPSCYSVEMPLFSFIQFLCHQACPASEKSEDILQNIKL